LFCLGIWYGATTLLPHKNILLEKLMAFIVVTQSFAAQIHYMFAHEYQRSRFLNCSSTSHISSTVLAGFYVKEYFERLEVAE